MQYRTSTARVAGYLGQATAVCGDHVAVHPGGGLAQINAFGLGW